MRISRWTIVSVVTLLTACAGTRSQSVPVRPRGAEEQIRSSRDDIDPPSRVARLNFLEGAVSLEPAGTDDWVGAVINRPVTIGDRLWVDTNARAELHTGMRRFV